METKFVSIGFSNMVNQNRVLAVLSPDTLPSKRLIADARVAQKLIDATCGRKTRALVLLDSGHVLLCGLQCDTIAARLNLETSANAMEEEQD